MNKICTIVNFFIDNLVFLFYNLIMEFNIKKLNESLTITGIVNVHFFEFPEGYYTETDKHDFYELVFVSSGEIIVSSEHFNGVIKKNQMIIHSPAEKHSLRCEKGYLPTAIIIGFTCSNNTLKSFAHQPINLNYSDVKKLAEIIKEGRNVFAPPYDAPVFDMKKKKKMLFGSEQMLKILLEYLFIGILRRKNSNLQGDDEDFFEPFSASEILTYLEENYREKITLDELAFIFRTNRSTLCKEFKNLTNQTIMEFLINKRLNQAKVQMINTDKTLTEIAELEGFESIHYFTRVFKNKMGISPKSFRKNYKN